MPDSARRPVRQAPDRQVRTNRKTRLRLSAVPPGEPRTEFPATRPAARTTGWKCPHRSPRRRSVLGPKYRFAVAVTDQVLVVGRQQVQRRGRSGKIRPRAMYQPLPIPEPQRFQLVPNRSDRRANVRCGQARPPGQIGNAPSPPDCGCENKRGPTGPTTRRASAREPARPAPRAAHR